MSLDEKHICEFWEKLAEAVKLKLEELQQQKQRPSPPCCIKKDVYNCKWVLLKHHLINVDDLSYACVDNVKSLINSEKKCCIEFVMKEAEDFYIYFDTVDEAKEALEEMYDNL